MCEGVHCAFCVSKTLSSFDKNIPFVLRSRLIALMQTNVMSSTPASDSTGGTRLRKVHLTLLPPEMELDRFLSRTTGRHHSWSTENDACKLWDGVKCEDQKVVELSWTSFGLSGSVEWRFLPRTVRHVDLGRLYDVSNKLTGRIQTCDLPDSLECLIVDRNSFCGELETQTFPSAMRNFEARENCLEGSVDLTALPCGQSTLDLNNNDLSGRIFLDSLPPQLRYLYLSHNRLSGEVNLTTLPEMLLELTATGNLLIGDLDLSRLPQSLRLLHLSGNKFDGTLNCRNLPEKAQIYVRTMNIRSSEPDPLPPRVNV